MRNIIFINVLFCTFICLSVSAPQNPEINDQFEEATHREAETLKQDESTKTDDPKSLENDKLILRATDEENTLQISEETHNVTQPGIMVTCYRTLTTPIVRFMSIPKVNNVLKNIGTCIVNGVMELISFYFPAPLIPLIASAAGLFIPFEPVVMLKEKMPVTSYRRAFRTAMETFLGTFDRYKVLEDDPYMTNRFNRRFMGNSKEVRTEKIVKGSNDID